MTENQKAKHSLKVRSFIKFKRVIIQEANVLAKLDFKLVYYDASGKYITGIPH